MQKYTLDHEERRTVDRLLSGLLEHNSSIEKASFLSYLELAAHDLPKPLKEFLHFYKENSNKHPVCCVSGYPIDDEGIGPTPSHWQSRQPASRQHENLYFLLCASLVSKPFAWSTQQGGHIVHEILPIKAYEGEQLGFSSNSYLEWHTEDAFHPLRADFIALMGMRNPARIPTLVASTAGIDLTKEDYKPLFEPVFEIRPDLSHLEATPVEGKVDPAMRLLDRDPIKAPILFGDPKDPYLRIDPHFTNEPQNKDAKNALDALISEIKSAIREVVIEPGDILFCDNYRVVHGRPPFCANYDGKDRWLKRINMTNDLRKSRSVRNTEDSRVLQ